MEWKEKANEGKRKCTMVEAQCSQNPERWITNLVWERREWKEHVGKLGIGSWERGTRGNEGKGS